MNIIKNKIFRVIATILGFFGISTAFTACYGVPVNYSYLNGWVYGDSLEGPVRDIQVTLTDINTSKVLDQTQTDEYGEFFFSNPPLTTVVITCEDIDGEENGKFKTTSQPYTIRGPRNSVGDIYLESDDSEE